MRWYAEKLGYAEEADFWETIGILHDLDFEQFPEEHCIKEQELGWKLDDLISETLFAMRADDDVD